MFVNQIKGLQLAIKDVKLNNSSYKIAYLLENQSQINTIVFLHGWGSNKELMHNTFRKTFKSFKHIYIDLPGFGKSSNDTVLTTEGYAKIINFFLEKLDLNITTIVGHSFGGKIATLLEPKNLVLLSSAGIIETKSKKVLLTIKMAKIFKKFGLSKVNKLLRSNDVNSMSETMYETFKNVVDEDFSLKFQSFQNNTIILWGDNDTATSLESGKKIHSLINKSFFKSYDGDHYFFMKHVDDIANTIKENLQ